MLESLTGFVHHLRRHGVGVSPAEVVDAARVLAEIGVESRAEVRCGLRLACAKDRPSRVVFDREFERYFASPARVGEARGRGTMGVGAGKPTVCRSEPTAGRPGRQSRREPEAEGALAMRLVELAARRSEAPARPETPARPRLRRVVIAASRDDPMPQTRSARRSADAPIERRDLRAPASAWPAADERRLVEEAVRRMTEIRLRLGRRLQLGRRGRLEIKQTARRSLRTGGIPFTLARRRRRRQRPRLVLLLDVSYSVARAAGLLLLVASEALSALASTRILAFVDRAVDCTRPLAVWARGPDSGRPDAVQPASFAAAIGNQVNLEAASDYGRVFYGLVGGRTGEGVSLGGGRLPGGRLPGGRLPGGPFPGGRLPGGRDLVLVILGDGRSNRFEPLAWAFEEVTRRARVVIWLVAERAATWGTGDSALEHYLPHVDIAVEAADLTGLVRALRLTLDQVTR